MAPGGANCSPTWTTPHPDGSRGNLRTHARWGNRVVLTATRLLFGHRFQDLPPFRAIRFTALQRLAMDDRDWGWTLQMQLRAVRHGLRIVEIDAPHRARAHGRSKISGRLGMSLRVGAKMFYTLARERGSAIRPDVDLDLEPIGSSPGKD